MPLLYRLPAAETQPKREQAPALHRAWASLECGGLPPLCRRILQERRPPTRSFLRAKRRPL